MMTSRLQAHLVRAHNFTLDSWRVQEQPATEHLREHALGQFEHPEDDLYISLEDEVTWDPGERVEVSEYERIQRV